MNSILKVLDFGNKDYKEVWDIQKVLHKRRVNGEIPDTLILVEHNPVITMGKSGKEENIRVPMELLKEKGIDFYNIERGGDVTFHGPGQLVGYPIFNIKMGLVGIKPFIEKIEEAIIATLSDFNIKGRKREKMIGVWVDDEKICSIGIAVKEWVSFHGFALNVNTDLRYFDLINPCGFINIKMTSMHKILNQLVAMAAVKESVVKNFCKIFLKKVDIGLFNDIIRIGRKR
uniref:Octanoyltransferase n=1 Tax=candidate division WOR-3 bacterium TaxID=2052148 RepID=A0A7C4TDR1_UNCW3